MRPSALLSVAQLAGINGQHPIGEVVDLGARMADIDHRQPGLGLDPFQERQDLLLQAFIQRRQRFVEQQQAR
ncbi:MAG: hypothetical protein Q8M37_12840 [Nevskia sp.]|nr:hypothetical protein [Nevskia sp.]